MNLGNLLLAILEQRTQTGYDLTNRTMPESGAWQASHQQVYRELGRMTEKGLVSHEIEAQDGKPDRKKYSITQGGERVLNLLRNESTCGNLSIIRSPASVMLEIGSETYFKSYIEKLNQEITQLKEKLNAHQKEKGVFCDNFTLHVERDIDVRKAELKFAERSLSMITSSNIATENAA
ncbi:MULTISPECIES: PadR family transcriptional regulator [Vibrio]|uniref:PadR family transcriptional regulator n=1 Tax=Vibrio TaxID=662 RepID=UPI0006ACB5D9|nr:MULTISPECIES: PadR family transcriptional regulator [Vibrio]EHD0131741.1 PadR family transcriptional regulator [Vibrio alginolyticus]EJN3360228.1 PadR family transcriptional regulator [Vibrio alginolyticus]EKL9830541.1 PadR family transcriptional regulator [Vibrio alginolyticus]EKZ9011390.1 PadR family transcriptional regulator [Vibrio alginolyticus]ELA9084095.1 PadR family transcriptional regulator [Vibrio alginolyticus]